MRIPNKKWEKRGIQKRMIRHNSHILIFAGGLFLALFLAGCGKGTDTGENGTTQVRENGQSNAGEMTGIAGETAKDTKVDIKALQTENPDIFAWLYIPDTDIDMPVLQSTESDDYYENNND